LRERQIRRDTEEILERKVARADDCQLEEAESARVDANRAKERFLANMSQSCGRRSTPIGFAAVDGAQPPR